MSSIGRGQYTLSARDWRGKRWDPLPFEGTQKELLDILDRMLPHLLASQTPLEGESDQ